MIVTRTMHWNRPTNWATQSHLCNNKANLRDLIAATGLVILLKFDPNHPFFSPCYLEIWWMNLENNRAPLLFYIKLCASFQSHGWIRTGVSGNTPFWVKIGNFLSRVTLKFDGWPWKTIGHLFYVASSFVYCFIAISEFKPELQSGNAQFGTKSMFFVPCDLEIWQMTLKTIGYLFYATSSFVHHFEDIGEFKLELHSGNSQFGSKSMIFFSRVTLKFDRWPWKTIGHLPWATSSSVHHFVIICEFKLELRSGNG